MMGVSRELTAGEVMLCAHDLASARGRVIEARDARIAELEALVDRYAPKDGDKRSTDELLAAFFAFVRQADDWASIYIDGNGMIMAEWAGDNSAISSLKFAPTTRATLLKALEDMG